MLSRAFRKIKAIFKRPVSYRYDDETNTRYRIAKKILGGKPNAEHLAQLLCLGGEEITDFGGAAGEMAEALAANGRRVTVVENPTMVRLAPRSPGVDFSTEIPAACDVFFTSGTLQYIESPLPVLDQAFASARLAVVLLRNTFSDAPIASIQKSWLSDNGSGPKDVPGFDDVRISYPHWTVREADVFAAAERHCFRCTLKQDDSDGLFPHRKGVYGRKLVFVRHGTPTAVM